MTKEQRVHYLKGGKFSAIYNPVGRDVTEESLNQLGRKITVYQNCLNTPIEDFKWNGQFRFNSPVIYGWFPEEDISKLEILDEFIDYPEPTTQYCYRLTYTKESQLLPNFGKGNWSLPLVVRREYNEESDDYVKKLSKPQATKIEKRVLDLIEGKNTEWEEIVL